MSRWRNLNQWMLDLDTFNHLYMWILLNAMYEGVVLLGCVVLGEKQYIRSIGKIREDLFYKVRMRSFRKRLDSEKYEYGACGNYVYWLGMSVNKGCDDSGIDQLDNKADSGLSSCGEKHVNRVRK